MDCLVQALERLLPTLYPKGDRRASEPDRASLPHSLLIRALISPDGTCHRDSPSTCKRWRAPPSFPHGRPLSNWMLFWPEHRLPKPNFGGIHDSRLCPSLLAQWRCLHVPTSSTLPHISPNPLLLHTYTCLDSFV